MQVSIRLAKPSDASALARIWVDGQRAMPVHIEDRDYTPMFAEKIAHQTPCFPVWVATTADGTVAGWQALSPSISHPYLQQFFAESSTYIDPATRAKGVGRALLSHAIEYAERTTLRYVTAYIKTDNAGALRLTDALGFQRIGDLPWPGEDGKLPHLMFLVYAVPHPTMAQRFLEDLIAEDAIGVETREFVRSEVFGEEKV